MLLRQIAYIAAKPGYPVAVVLAGSGAGSSRRTRNERSENSDLDIRRSRCRRSNWRSDARDGHLDLHRRWRRCWDWRGSWQALTVKAQSSASIATAACYGRTRAVVAARAKRRLFWATVPKDTRKDQLRGGKRASNSLPVSTRRNRHRTLLDTLPSLDLVARRLRPGPNECRGHSKRTNAAAGAATRIVQE
jgi:hypothetical protein